MRSESEHKSGLASLGLDSQSKGGGNFPLQQLCDVICHFKAEPELIG